MTAVLSKMQEQGVFEITPELLARLSPYRTIHINPFGDYIMDLERTVEPMNTRVRFGFKERAKMA